MEDESLAARDIVAEVEHPERGRFKTVGCPLKLSDSPVEVTTSPRLGEHTQEILRELVGYDAEEVEAARTEGRNLTPRSAHYPACHSLPGSWTFLIVYIGGMLAIGVLAGRRVKHADDFATARGAYGPLFLAFAFAATTASGATFLGSSGLGYEWGLPTMWGCFLYPTGMYVGVLVAMRLITTFGPSVWEPLHTGIPRRPLPVRRHSDTHFGLFLGAVFLSGRPVGIRAGDVRDYAGPVPPCGRCSLPRACC